MNLLDCITDLENDNPRLKTDGYKITSKCTDDYNCFAYAANDLTHWWEPTKLPPYYWPVSQYDYEQESFVNAFQTIGFTKTEDSCKQEDEEIIAIFIDDDGDVIHAAVQEVEGIWKSKCGDRFDIVHELDSLSGYGKVAFYMKRPRVTRSVPSFDINSTCAFHQNPFEST